MNAENFIDFIKWLEDNKRVYLMDITGNKDRFITSCYGGFNSDWDELGSLIEEYRKEVYK